MGKDGLQARITALEEEVESVADWQAIFFQCCNGGGKDRCLQAGNCDTARGVSVRWVNLKWQWKRSSKKSGPPVGARWLGSSISHQWNERRLGTTKECSEHCGAAEGVPRQELRKASTFRAAC